MKSARCLSRNYCCFLWSHCVEIWPRWPWLHFFRPQLMNQNKVTLWKKRISNLIGVTEWIRDFEDQFSPRNPCPHGSRFLPQFCCKASPLLLHEQPLTATTEPVKTKLIKLENSYKKQTNRLEIAKLSYLIFCFFALPLLTQGLAFGVWGVFFGFGFLWLCRREIFRQYGLLELIL